MVPLTDLNKSHLNASSSPHKSHLKAIIIDDDTTAALGVNLALSRLSVEVVAQVATIEQALEFDSDIVCCDLSLSREGNILQGASGIEVLASHGRKVLALSVIAREALVGDVIGAGALAYMDKTELDWSEFKNAVGDVAAGVKHLSRSLASRLLIDLKKRPLPPAMELDSRAQAALEYFLTHKQVVDSQGYGQETQALKDRIWSVWAKRRITYAVSLSPRQLEMLRLFHGGFDAGKIAKELNIAVRTVQADQDKVKQMLFSAYGIDLKREAACRMVWELLDGQVSWGKSSSTFNK